MSIIPSAAAGEPRPVAVPVPIPDAVAILVGRQMPEHVLRAEYEAEGQAYTVYLCRGPQYREARERALAELARANKVLAAYNPRLIVTPKAVRSA